MKIFGLDVPLELQSLFYNLVSVPATGASAGTTAYTKRSVSLSTKKTRNPVDKWQWVAEQVYEQIKGLEGIDTGPGFISEERDRLKDGIYNAIYWLTASKQSEEFLTNTPANVEDTSPPPYSYRDPNYLPATTTYGDGTPASAPMKTSGALVGTQWQDGAWTWRKSIFIITTNDQLPAELPLIWISKGTIQADASTRGSRPMLSIIMKAWLSDLGNTISDTLQPPTGNKSSIYWLYDLPDEVPPYYHASAPISQHKILNGTAKLITGGPVQKLTVLTAPRPMFGRGFNNNNSVQTSYTDTETVMQLNPNIKTPPYAEQIVHVTWYSGGFGGNVSTQTYEPAEALWPTRQINAAIEYLKSKIPEYVWWQGGGPYEPWQLIPADATPYGNFQYAGPATVIVKRNTIWGAYTFLVGFEIYNRLIVNEFPGLPMGQIDDWDNR
jgi:hypothetical protein